MMSRPTFNSTWKRFFWLIVWVLVLVVYLFPFAWMVMTGFRNPVDTYCWPPKFIFTPTFQGFPQTWNPSWGEFGGDSQGLVTMHFTNGVRAFYEGAKTNAIGLNGWTNEYIRAECREATLILDRRYLEQFPYNPDQQWASQRHGEGLALTLRQQAKWANSWLIEKFVDWIKGGEPMETNVWDNLQSVALIFAAIKSARTGQPVAVQQYLKMTQEQLA